MTIGMFGRPESERPNPDFVSLVDCRKRVSDALDVPLDSLELSMGMSGDFEHAVSPLVACME